MYTVILHDIHPEAEMEVPGAQLLNRKFLTVLLLNNCQIFRCDEIVQHRKIAPWTILTQPGARTIPTQRAARRAKRAAGRKSRPRRARSARLGRLFRPAARCVGIVALA